MGFFRPRGKLGFPIKLLMGIFIANILSMVLMNSFVIDTAYFAYIYLICGIIAYIAIRYAGIDHASNPRLLFSSREKKLLAIAFIVMSLLYILPRSGYALEAYLGRVIDPICGDDYWHFQELSSLINTKSYPPVSTFDSSKYFSHYYAPWMIMVFIHSMVALNINTIKTSYFFGYSLYIVLLTYSIFYLSYRFSSSRQQFYILLYLILLHSGIESLYAFAYPLAHNETWINKFGFPLQFSSFSTLALWVIHHLSAAVSLIFAYYVFLKSQEDRLQHQRYALYAITALLLVNALYSSVFVFLGAAPFIVYVGLKSLPMNKAGLGVIFAICTLAAAPILWMYMGKHADLGFRLFPGAIHSLPQLPDNITRGIHLSLSFSKFLTLLALEFLGFILS